jgi:hypothetical protein
MRLFVIGSFFCLVDCCGGLQILSKSDDSVWEGEHYGKCDYS